MAVRTIRVYPDPVLRKKASPATVFDEDMERLVKDLWDTMYAAPGVGLAAPQIGVSSRVIVVDIRSQEPDTKPYALLNPVIDSKEGGVVGDEACLSVPEYSDQVQRAERVTVQAQDTSGHPVEIHAHGLLARVLQHEVDHLDGVLFVDRLSALKRDLYKRRVRKALKVGV